MKTNVVVSSIAAFIILAFFSFAAAFLFGVRKGASAPADRAREECSGALSGRPLVDQRYVELRESRTASADGEVVSWNIVIRKFDGFDIWVLLDGIDPGLDGGGNRIYVEVGDEERTFRTQPSRSGKISFYREFAYGSVTDAWPERGAERMLVDYPVRGRSRIVQADGKHSLFGRDTHSGKMMHAVDVSAGIGAVVVAVRDGLVVHAVDGYPDAGCYLPELKARSNTVVVLHDDGTEAVYGHLMQGSIGVDAGSRVRAGESIARVGNSGMSSQPHLHLQVGGLTEHGYRTIPLGFQGCGSGSFLPRLGEVSCE
ncbi:murein hydrolase activator EnvC family protein [Pseudoxanthomonas suwonensis]|uniref:murein hydrolase activator EnvC family protein n=1 Tax=Pseudoxanthomonas suwonensis TaxID=314722 RepID=UPI000697E9C9|nr:M23 family metallopeptidase [Pseudoxanthomonas suwonensis]